MAKHNKKHSKINWKRVKLTHHLHKTRKIHKRWIPRYRLRPGSLKRWAKRYGFLNKDGTISLRRAEAYVKHNFGRRMVKKRKYHLGMGYYPRTDAKRLRQILMLKTGKKYIKSSGLVRNYSKKCR